MSEMLSSQYEKSLRMPLDNDTVSDPEFFFAEDHEEEMELSLPHMHFTNASPGPDYFPAILIKRGKITLCHTIPKIFRSSTER